MKKITYFKEVNYGKSTRKIIMFNSKLLVCQRVNTVSSWYPGIPFSLSTGIMYCIEDTTYRIAVDDPMDFFHGLIPVDSSSMPHLPWLFHTPNYTNQ